MRERSGGRGLRTLLASVLLLLSLGCKQCPPPNQPEPPFRPDWTETRHAHATISTHDDDALLRVEVGPGAREHPPRQLLLCNVDDDDGLNGRDCENDEIDGQADAEDLARVEIGPIRNCTDHRVVVRVADASAIRLFDGNGYSRLGPEVGATWTLAPDMLQKLETDRMRVFAEGCAFGARTELDVVVDDRVVAQAVLAVAPLLLHPPGTPAEKIEIGRKSYETRESDSYYGRFVRAYDEIPPDDLRPPLRDVLISGEPYLNDFWLQDALQWAYTKTPFAYLPVAVRMPRGRPLRLWAEAQLKHDVGTVRPCPWPDYAVQPVKLAYGGNLEACATSAVDTRGCALHGFRAGEYPVPVLEHDRLARLREFLDEAGGQAVLEVNTSWLSIGHVDEIVGVVPDPDQEGGIVVLLASPGDAIAILETMADDPVPSVFADRYHEEVDVPEDPTQQEDEPVLRWKHFLEASVSGYDTTSLTAYNLAIERTLYGDPLAPDQPAGLGPLIEVLEAAGMAPVRVPVLFYRFDDEVEGFTHASALLPNCLNLVPVGRWLLTPDPLLDKFKVVLDGRFQVKWIETFDFLHSERGGLHCATNTKPDRPSGG